MRLVTRMHVSSIATVGDRASGYRTSMASENSLIVSAVMHSRSSGVGSTCSHARTAISILERRSLSDRRHLCVARVGASVGGVAWERHGIESTYGEIAIDDDAYGSAVVVAAPVCVSFWSTERSVRAGTGGASRDGSTGDDRHSDRAKPRHERERLDNAEIVRGSGHSGEQSTPTRGGLGSASVPVTSKQLDDGRTRFVGSHPSRCDRRRRSLTPSSPSASAARGTTSALSPASRMVLEGPADRRCVGAAIGEERRLLIVVIPAPVIVVTEPVTAIPVGRVPLLVHGLRRCDVFGRRRRPLRGSGTAGEEHGGECSNCRRENDRFQDVHAASPRSSTWLRYGMVSALRRFDETGLQQFTTSARAHANF